MLSNGSAWGERGFWQPPGLGAAVCDSIVGVRPASSSDRCGSQLYCCLLGFPRHLLLGHVSAPRIAALPEIRAAGSKGQVSRRAEASTSQQVAAARYLGAMVRAGVMLACLLLCACGSAGARVAGTWPCPPTPSPSNIASASPLGWAMGAGVRGTRAVG